MGGTVGSSRSETANDGKNNITETVEIITWDELQAAFYTDCSIVLMRDLRPGSNMDDLIIPAGVTVTLDLNGHTLNLAYYNLSCEINGSLTIIVADHLR